MSYHEIAVLLNRDDRTIWTCYNRGKKKIAASKEENNSESDGLQESQESQESQSKNSGTTPAKKRTRTGARKSSENRSENKFENRSDKKSLEKGE